MTDEAAIERFHTIILDFLLHPALIGRYVKFELSRSSNGKWKIHLSNSALMPNEIKIEYTTKGHTTLLETVEDMKQQLGEY